MPEKIFGPLATAASPPRDQGTLNARGRGEDDLLLECTFAANRMEGNQRKFIGEESECRKQDRGGKCKGGIENPPRISVKIYSLYLMIIVLV